MSISIERLKTITGGSTTPTTSSGKAPSVERLRTIVSTPIAPKTPATTTMVSETVAPPKQSLFQKVKSTIGSLFNQPSQRETFDKAVQMYEEDTGQKVSQEEVNALSEKLLKSSGNDTEKAKYQAETYNNYLLKILDDKIFQLGMSQEKNDTEAVAKYTKQIKEITDAYDSPLLSSTSLRNKETVASKYGAERAGRAFVVGASTAVSSLAGASQFVNEYMADKTENLTNTQGLPEPFVKALDAFVARRQDKAGKAEKVSQDVKRWASETMPSNATMGEQLVSGLGSTVPYMIVGYLTAGAGLAAATIPVSATMESLSESGAVYSDLRDKGQSVEEAEDNFAKVFIGNEIFNLITDKFGIPDAINKSMTGKIKSDIVSTIINSIKVPLAEGAQEYYQYILSELGSDRVKSKEDLVKVATSKEAKMEGGFGALIAASMNSMVNAIGEVRAQHPELAAEANAKVEELKRDVEGKALPTEEQLKGVKTLYHGTEVKNIPSILENGLTPSEEGMDFGKGVYFGGTEKAVTYGDGVVMSDVDTSNFKVFETPTEFIEESAKYPNIEAFTKHLKDDFGGVYIKSKDTYVVYEPNLIKSLREGEATISEEGLNVVEKAIAPKPTTEKATQGIVEAKKGIEKTDYVYHTTSNKALTKIMATGLKPATGQYGKAVYFAPSETTTQGYGSPNEVMLRVKRKSLKGAQDFTDQVFTKSGITAKDIEIKTADGKWVSLTSQKTKTSLSPRKKTVVKKKKVSIAPKKKIRVLPKTTSVPRSQLPVGTGEKGVSRLEARMKKALGLVSKDDIDSIGLTTYNKMNEDEQIAEAAKYVQENPDEALEVLKGNIEPPKGLLRNSVYVAMTQNAKGKIDLQTKLASLGATRYGQEIDILKKLDPDSPVRWLSEAVKIKEDAIQKKYKKKASEKIKEVSKQIKDKIKVADKYDWKSFIDSVEC